MSARSKACLQSSDDKTYNGNNFDAAQPELEFAEEADAEVVDANDRDQEHRYPYTRIYFVFRFPQLNNEGRCGKLVGCRDDVLEPVSPTESETKSGVAETSGITSEAVSSGNPSSHFAEGAHDNVDEKTSSSVGDENRAGTGHC